MTDPSDLPPLDDDLRALLREHSGQSVSSDPAFDAMARVRSRVDASIAAAAAAAAATAATAATPDERGPSGGPSAAPSAEPAAAPGAAAAAATKSTLAVVALVAFGLGAASGVIGSRVVSPREVVRIEERRVEVPVRVVETVYVVADAGIRTAELASAPGDAGRSASASDTPAATVDAGAAAGNGRDRDLAGENALVSRAQSALARGRTGEALEAIAEHQRRFPSGEFVEEREALAIQALARSGRMDAARARASRFRARYPRSMLLRAVDAVVGPEATP
jgi:hypothetical protein